MKLSTKNNLFLMAPLLSCCAGMDAEFTNKILKLNNAFEKASTKSLNLIYIFQYKK